LHGPGFTRAAGTQEAHDVAVLTAKGMAAAGWKVLTDEIATQVWQDFEKDKLLQ